MSRKIEYIARYMETVDHGEQQGGPKLVDFYEERSGRVHDVLDKIAARLATTLGLHFAVVVDVAGNEQPPPFVTITLTFLRRG